MFAIDSRSCPDIGRPAVQPGQRMGRAASAPTRLPIRRGAGTADGEASQARIAATR